MAIIKTSSMIDAVSGKLGGVTFANGRNVTVARNTPPKKKSTTGAALTQRNRYNFMVQGWRDMTDELRQEWRTAAESFKTVDRLGTTRTLGGFQLYMRIALRRTTLTTPSGLTPPIGYNEFPTRNPALVIVSGGTKRITYTSTGLDVGPIITMWGSRPFTNAPINYTRAWRRLANGNILDHEFLFTTQWDDTFGDPEPGERCAVRYYLEGDRFFPTAWTELYATAT